jgi:hypothetical protein
MGGRMVGAYVRLTSVIAIALLARRSLLSGLRRWLIGSKRVGCSRANGLSSFWFYTSSYAVAFAASAGLLIYFGFQAASI